MPAYHAKGLELLMMLRLMINNGDHNHNHTLMRIMTMPMMIATIILIEMKCKNLDPVGIRKKGSEKLKFLIKIIKIVDKNN